MTDLLFFVSQFYSIDHIYNFQIPKKKICFLGIILIPIPSFPRDFWRNSQGNGQHAAESWGILNSITSWLGATGQVTQPHLT